MPEKYADGDVVTLIIAVQQIMTGLHTVDTEEHRFYYESHSRTGYTKIRVKISPMRSCSTISTPVPTSPLFPTGGNSMNYQTISPMQAKSGHETTQDSML